MPIFMRSLSVITLFAGTLLAGTSAYCQTPQELPSAPSTTVAPAPRQTAPQTAPAQKPVPAPDQKPVLQSLEDRKKQPIPQKGTTDPSDSLAPPADSETDKPKTVQSEKDKQDEFTVSKKVDEVNVIFTVTDK